MSETDSDDRRLSKRKSVERFTLLVTGTRVSQ